MLQNQSRITTEVATPVPVAKNPLQAVDEGNDAVRELQEQLSQREYEIRLLKETAEAVSSQLHLERLFQLVADRARELIPCETVLVPVLEEGCKEYTYRACSGTHAEDIVGETLSIEYGICGWVWRNKRPWWQGMLNELAEVERNHWEHEAGSILMVPLIGKNHFLGGLSCINRLDGEIFSQRDLDLLTLFGNQVSIAIENAITFEALEQEKERAEEYQNKLHLLNQELISINSDLEHMALYDSLTGLANRYLIQDRMQQSFHLNSQSDHSVAILVVDLDRFKEVNDTLGHHVGDEILKQVGQRFQGKLRKADTIGRLGGDEFAVVIPNADAETATLVARNLMQSLQFPVELDSGSYIVSASMGIAIYPQHGNDVQTLLRRADVAMYEAKSSKDGWFVYDPQKDRNTPRRLTLMADLHTALDNNQIELYYQPKLELCSDTIIGVEALMRWHHPQQGMIPPDIFIPALEQSGHIKRYTAWVLDQAFHQCVLWNEMGLDLSMSVNLSMYNLRDTDLSAHLQMLQKLWKPRKNALVMEVTESAVMNDPHQIASILEEIKAGGIHFTIDDYGTGYSSLSHLKRLSVAELKIDKSFVKDMDHDRDDELIVHSTIDMAHNMGLQVVAEGVENQAVLARLRAMGCDQVQGYYIAKPMSAEYLESFFRNTEWKLRKIPD